MEYPSPFGSIPSYFSGGSSVPIQKDNGLDFSQKASGNPSRSVKKSKPSMKLSREEGSWRLNPIASYGVNVPFNPMTQSGSRDVNKKHHSAPRLGISQMDTGYGYPRFPEMFHPSAEIHNHNSGHSLGRSEMPRPLPPALGRGKFTVAKPKARKSRQTEFQDNYTQFSMPPPIIGFSSAPNKKRTSIDRKSAGREPSKSKKSQAKNDNANLNARWRAVEDTHCTRLVDLITLKPGEEADFERELDSTMTLNESQRKKRKLDAKPSIKAKRLSSLKASNGPHESSVQASPDWSSGQNVKVVAKVRVNPSPEERYRKPVAGHQDSEILENYYGAKKRILTVLKRAKPLASSRKPDRSKLNAVLAVKKEKPDSSHGSESSLHPAAEWGHAAFSPAGRSLKRSSHDRSPFVDDLYGSFASVGSTPSHADSDMSSDPEADESRRKILAQLQKLNDKRARLEAQLTKIQKHNSGPDDRSADHSRASSVATNLAFRDSDIKMRPIGRTRPIPGRRDLLKEQWKIISQICVPLCHRIRMIRREEGAVARSKLGAACLRDHAENRLESEKLANEYQQRAKFMVRDMFTRWKVIDKEEKKYKKLKEKEEVEQKRIDLEMQEAKRQQRKLNFLITQTELYAHFMGKKISGTEDTEADSAFDPSILKRLDEAAEPVDKPVAEDAEPDLTDKLVGEKAKENVVRSVEQAYIDNQKRISKFAIMTADATLTPPGASKFDGNDGKMLVEPKMFLGSLKVYQKKGISWLASLFSNGINGILADEMGLGKTVQSIAFLGHLAEEHGIWGPFLIVAPASTLHNWQQEFHRFLPSFKAVPYWGTTEERKVLRQFWKVDKMHTEQASFHVVITSYQLVVQDASYLKKIKWQYMILDEAQAIKSSTSIRWKLLLDFPCRNRLLLTGTPIQNSMAELWALLHFIMPSLFDSHSEFNEWFSRDIESHAENKSQIDEKHLSRLHMILKPFMMRRIKRDVEEELTDKIEIMVNCPLTRRQRNLYEALKHKISIEDLLYTSTSTSSQSESTSSALMNLVMQFRKVCNHPELFERRDIKSPVFLSGIEYPVPRLVYEETVRCSQKHSHQQLIDKYFLLSSPWNAPAHDSSVLSSVMSFSKFHPVAAQDINRVYRGGLFERLNLYFSLQTRRSKLAFAQPWSSSVSRKDFLFLDHQFPSESSLAKNFLAVDVETRRYSYGVCKIHYIAEDKPKKARQDQEAFTADDSQDPEVEEPKLPRTIDFYPLHIPHFFVSYVPRALSRSPVMYCYDRHAESERLLLNLRNCKVEQRKMIWFGSPQLSEQAKENWEYLRPTPIGGIVGLRPTGGWSPMEIPDKQHLVVDSGKLRVLDNLLHRLKDEGHRVLIYSLMTKMMDILEEFMVHKRYAYIRLDGSSKIADRRDMVKDFQTREDIFVFLLSTRAGGLGINLTAADTVIFFDSDWNPTVDQQAMDRAHRLGQTKQVTVYRLICRNTVEERILERAQEKSEIQRMVISGGDYRPDTLKPTEVVSLLLDDDEIKNRLRVKEGEVSAKEDAPKSRKPPRKRDPGSAQPRRKKPATDAPAVSSGAPPSKKKAPAKKTSLPVVRASVEAAPAEAGTSSSVPSVVPVALTPLIGALPMSSSKKKPTAHNSKPSGQVPSISVIKIPVAVPTLIAENPPQIPSSNSALSSSASSVPAKKRKRPQSPSPSTTALPETRPPPKKKLSHTAIGPVVAVGEASAERISSAGPLSGNKLKIPASAKSKTAPKIETA